MSQRAKTARHTRSIEQGYIYVYVYMHVLWAHVLPAAAAVPCVLQHGLVGVPAPHPEVKGYNQPEAKRPESSAGSERM